MKAFFSKVKTYPFFSSITPFTSIKLFDFSFSFSSSFSVNASKDLNGYITLGHSFILNFSLIIMKLM